jgi:hypothetical protein
VPSEHAVGCAKDDTWALAVGKIGSWAGCREKWRGGWADHPLQAQQPIEHSIFSFFILLFLFLYFIIFSPTKFWALQWSII